MANSKLLMPLFLIIMISKSVKGDAPTPTPKIYLPEQIFITAATDYLTGTTHTKFDGEIKCVKETSEIELGQSDQIKLKYIDVKENVEIGSALTKHEDTSTNKKLGIKLLSDNTKSIIFTLNNAYKALLVGATEDECYKNYLVTEQEKKDQYVHLTYIKCFKLEEVAAYKTRTSGETNKKYVVGTKHLCFLPSLVIEPMCIEASDKTKSYTIIISPYPSPEKKCQTFTKSCPAKPVNASSNVTETAKQSAAPIIISVVVIIVVIIAGGVGYVMMKK